MLMFDIYSKIWFISAICNSNMHILVSALKSNDAHAMMELFCKHVTADKYRHKHSACDQYRMHFVINVGINWECQLLFNSHGAGVCFELNRLHWVLSVPHLRLCIFQLYFRLCFVHLNLVSAADLSVLICLFFRFCLIELLYLIQCFFTNQCFITVFSWQLNNFLTASLNS